MVESAQPRGPVRTIACYHCGHAFEIPARALSTSCPKCSKPLAVEDVVVKSVHFVRKVQTCGKIVVEAKGNLNAALIVAQLGVEVQGILEGNVTSAGPVHLGPKAKWKGDCKAPTLRVELGAQIAKGFFEIRPGERAPVAVPSDPADAAPGGPAKAPAPSTRKGPGKS